jgi:hypothetical protein
MKKPKQEITMKTLITTLLLIIFTTTAQAKPQCTNTDLAIGVGVGTVAAVAVGVGTVATSPLIGAGVVAGSTVGWAGAFTMPILINSTLASIATASVVVAPLTAFVGYYASCVVSSVNK